jgi:hypothetical protein
MYVVRLRNGNEIDRLHLTPLFTEEQPQGSRPDKGPGAALQRWPVDYEKDFKDSEREDFSKLVSERPVVQLMHFADYDHDGKATEFYLQTESLPCGKSIGVVIGISRREPKLHVFTTTSNPGKPLYLQKREWEALRDSSSGVVEVEDWACGDHGADIQTEVVLRWSATGVDGTSREYTCPAPGQKRQLLKEGSLYPER